MNDGFVNISADSMVDMHGRRPVTLSPEFAREWLDLATPKGRAEQMVLLRGKPTEAFEWFKIDRAVRSVKNHGPELIQPISDSLL